MTDQIELPLKTRLRVLREDVAHMSKAEMAEAFPMSTSTLNTWEAGQFVPKPRKLKRFAEVIAEHSDLDFKAALEFLDDVPVEHPARTAAERRRASRRAPSRQQRETPRWVPAVRAAA